MIQELARYWAADYDWRTCEARLSALPHFMTEIDGLDIHLIHVRSRHEDALPLIVTHGWPGSVIEQLKIIDPLPTWLPELPLALLISSPVTRGRPEVEAAGQVQSGWPGPHLWRLRPGPRGRQASHGGQA